MLEIFITLFLVLLNGFFVAAEFAIVKVRLSQIELKAQVGHKRAILSKKIINNLNGYLAATQLGITLASLGLGWIGEPIVSQLILQLMNTVGIEIQPELAHDIALPLAFMVITILHIVFGELAPKSIAIQSSEQTALWIAYPLRLFYIVFKPFIWLLNGIANYMLRFVGIHPSHGSEVHSSAELRYLIRQGKDEGVIEQGDFNIINNAFEFSEQIVKNVMVPRTKVFAVNVHTFNNESIEKIIEVGYSRIPCFEGSLDHVLGVVFLKDILLKLKKNEKINIHTLMRPVMSVPEIKTIGTLLKEFQSKHQHMAIIMDEHGGMKGIVTMEDILEELVGEIQDEYDSETPVVEKTSDTTYVVIASSSIRDINEKLPHPVTKDDHYESLAGILIGKIGRIPNTNEKIIFDGYEFTVVKKIRHSIILLHLRDLH